MRTTTRRSASLTTASGVEEFRFAGELSAEEIEAIVNYDGEVLTLEEVRG